MRQRLALLAAGLALMTGCQIDEALPDPASRPDPAARAACLAEGGEYRRGGILQEFLCFTPTPDAGKACTTGADCNGLCLAESMSCSAVRPLFGCHDMVTEDGMRTMICID